MAMWDAWRRLADVVEEQDRRIEQLEANLMTLIRALKAERD